MRSAEFVTRGYPEHDIIPTGSTAAARGQKLPIAITRYYLQAEKKANGQRATNRFLLGYKDYENHDRPK